MTGSFIHADFDPIPYLLFGITSIVTGLLVELRAARMNKKSAPPIAMPHSAARKAGLGRLFGRLKLRDRFAR